MQVQISSTYLVSNMNSYLWKLVRVTGTVYFFSYLHEPSSQVPGRELAPASTLHSQGQIKALKEITEYNHICAKLFPMYLGSKHKLTFYTALAFQSVQKNFPKSKTGGAVPNHMIKVKMN
jgi:hypothetical protein